MSNVATLINKSNTKPLGIIIKYNCKNEANFPFMEKYQFKCILYKVEVHNLGPNISKVSRNY